MGDQGGWESWNSTNDAWMKSAQISVQVYTSVKASLLIARSSKRNEKNTWNLSAFQKRQLVTWQNSSVVFVFGRIEEESHFNRIIVAGGAGLALLGWGAARLYAELLPSQRLFLLCWGDSCGSGTISPHNNALSGSSPAKLALKCVFSFFFK